MTLLKSTGQLFSRMFFNLGLIFSLDVNEITSYQEGLTEVGALLNTPMKGHMLSIYRAGNANLGH